MNQKLIDAIWKSNIYFFGSKKIEKQSFYMFYGFLWFAILVLIFIAVINLI